MLKAKAVSVHTTGTGAGGVSTNRYPHGIPAAHHHHHSAFERKQGASAELQWMLVRNHNSFLCKRTQDARKDRRRTVFTKEPNNLMALNSYKYSRSVAL